jgi:UDP:flavonoid glycosyltransferase YjiC (YdhE family)
MSDALARSSAPGRAPVYMTLGSWMPQDLPNQADALRMLTEAATLAGCRAVIQASHWEACGFRSDERIMYVSAAPHHLVLPRCAAVVHHGGAGTTQSATLAGVPHVVIAHISEQEHWARVAARGRGRQAAGTAQHRRPRWRSTSARSCGCRM